MPHVLVAGKLHPSGIRLLESAGGITFDYVEEVSEPSYAPLIGKADGLIIRTQPLSAPTVALAPSLKIVSRHGVGYDAIHLPSLNERGIVLAVVGDVNSVSVAEHTMMLLLALTKHALSADRAVRDNQWGWRNRLDASELAGKRLLIVGYGRIGRHLARMAACFGMDVRAHDPFLENAGWPAGSVAPAGDLLSALSWCDAVSINAPRGERPLIAAQELAALKRTAVLVNTARGGVVDESALIEALRKGQLAGAGLDVLEDEPPRTDNPLLAMSNVILSPHIAGLTAECGERMAVSSVRNVLNFFAGCIDPALLVNADAVSRSSGSGSGETNGYRARLQQPLPKEP